MQDSQTKEKDRDRTLRLVFSGFRGHLAPRKSLRSFLDLSNVTDPIYFNTYRHGDSLRRRWRRTERFIKEVMRDLSVSKIQILGYSMGCHLAVHAAKSLMNDGLNVDVVLLVVPDPKYRKCEEDRIDNLKGMQSAYKEARTLWGIARGKCIDSPGKRLAETLMELIQQGVEVHAVASKIDAVAEWPENVEELRKATEDKGMHWWLLEDPENRSFGRSSTYRVSILKMQPLPDDESLDGGALSEYWIHSQLDCVIQLSESCP